jgi:protein FRG1
MVKPLSFKGDPKPKKRKRIDAATKFGVACETSETARNADAESVGDDTWVSAEAASDLAGPVVIVLPSAKPACLACDSNGTVFPSLLENVVDDNPATAEPHDVRQVWVVTRVAGTDHISFKGHHGK